MELNFNNPFFVLLSIVGLCATVLGIISIKFPPKRINILIRHRSERARKNQENWDFAQKYWAPQLIYAGVLMMISSVIGLFLKGSSIVWMWMGLLFMIIILLGFSFKTEQALKKFEQKKF